jgi:hypothetical protein
VVDILLKDPRGRAEPCGPKAVDPSAENQYAIKWAVYRGHLQVVTLLLQDHRGRAEPCGPKAVDPSVDGQYTIKMAINMRHYEIEKLLLQDSRVVGFTHPGYYSCIS